MAISKDQIKEINDICEKFGIHFVKQHFLNKLDAQFVLSDLQKQSHHFSELSRQAAAELVLDKAKIDKIVGRKSDIPEFLILGLDYENKKDALKMYEAEYKKLESEFKSIAEFDQKLKDSMQEATSIDEIYSVLNDFMTKSNVPERYKKYIADSIPGIIQNSGRAHKDNLNNYLEQLKLDYPYNKELQNIPSLSVSAEEITTKDFNIFANTYLESLTKYKKELESIEILGPKHQNKIKRYIDNLEESIYIIKESMLSVNKTNLVGFKDIQSLYKASIVIRQCKHIDEVLKLNTKITEQAESLTIIENFYKSIDAKNKIEAIENIRPGYKQGFETYMSSYFHEYGKDLAEVNLNESKTLGLKEFEEISEKNEKKILQLQNEMLKSIQEDASFMAEMIRFLEQIHEEKFPGKKIQPPSSTYKKFSEELTEKINTGKVLSASELQDIINLKTQIDNAKSQRYNRVYLQEQFIDPGLQHMYKTMQDMLEDIKILEEDLLKNNKKISDEMSELKTKLKQDYEELYGVAYPIILDSWKFWENKKDITLSPDDYKKIIDNAKLIINSVDKLEKLSALDKKDGGQLENIAKNRWYRNFKKRLIFTAKLIAFVAIVTGVAMLAVSLLGTPLGAGALFVVGGSSFINQQLRSFLISYIKKTIVDMSISYLWSKAKSVFTGENQEFRSLPDIWPGNISDPQKNTNQENPKLTFSEDSKSLTAKSVNRDNGNDGKEPKPKPE